MRLLRFDYRLLPLLTTMAIMASCSDGGSDGNSGPSQDVNDIALAVFEFQVAEQGFTHQKVLFLEFDGEDPDTRIMEEFEGRMVENSEGLLIEVKPLLASEWVAPEGHDCGRPVDIETGVPGTLFEVHSNPNWTSETSVTIWGGYTASCEGGTWGTYSLEWIDGMWAVQSFTAELAS